MGTNRAAIVSLVEATKDKELQRIANKIINKERILFDEEIYYLVLRVTSHT